MINTTDLTRVPREVQTASIDGHNGMTLRDYLRHADPNRWQARQGGRKPHSTMTQSARHATQSPVYATLTNRAGLISNLLHSCLVASNTRRMTQSVPVMFRASPPRFAPLS